MLSIYSSYLSASILFNKKKITMILFLNNCFYKIFFLIKLLQKIIIIFMKNSLYKISYSCLKLKISLKISKYGAETIRKGW